MLFLFYLQCSNCSSCNSGKRRKKTNLSLYTSRKKKKCPRKFTSNESTCSCSNSSLSETSGAPWRISNYLYEDQNSRFSLPQLSSAESSCHSSRSSTNVSFISENRSEVNIAQDIFPHPELCSPIPCGSVHSKFTVVTSTPRASGSTLKCPPSEPLCLISDDELFSLAEINHVVDSNSEPISSNDLKSNGNDALISNEDLFSLAMEISNVCGNDNTETSSELSVCNSESSFLTSSFQATTRKNLVTLTNKNIVAEALSNLEIHNLSQDFTNFVTGFADGTIKPTDQPVLSALDFVHFRNLKDTRNMAYSQQSLDFWLCILKLLGGPSLRLFSGPKGSGETNYDPKQIMIQNCVKSISPYLLYQHF